MIDRRIKIRHLEAFSAIARMGALKPACEVLNLSAPALSKTLKELEDILGTTLMTRDRGGAKLTPSGRLFLDFTNQSLAALHRGVDGVSAMSAGADTRLRVGALPSVMARLIPAAVTLFQRSAPDTRLTLRDGPHGTMTDALRAGDLDMVVGRLGMAEAMTGLTFTQLYLEQVVCVVRPGHPLTTGTPTAHEISDWTVLYPPEGAAIRPLLDRWCLAQGLAPFARRIDSVSGAFGRVFIPTSDVVWFISEGVVSQELADGRLVALPLDMGLTAGPVGLMTRPSGPRSLAQDLFEHALREAAGNLQLKR
jgi:LysR family pca operon transcriptional activator